MKKKFRLITVLSLSLFACYLLWSSSDRDVTGPHPELKVQAVEEYGRDTNHGNLVAIQPFMVPTDYASQTSFYLKMDGYFGAAKYKGWFSPKTVVVLPEYIGTWLVVAGEKKTVYTAATTAEAMKTLVASNLFSFLFYLSRAYARDPVKYSIFRMKATKMADIYHNVFSTLAKRYGVTIAAGSIVLPSPKVVNGILRVGDGKLYNVTVVYHPSGLAHPHIVSKAFPIPDELAFTTPGPGQDLPVFETPAGRLGVLICADSWYASPYRVLKEKKADCLVALSYLSLDNALQQRWGGLAGKSSQKVSAITEEEAWLKYSLPHLIQTTDAAYGVTVFLRGKFWEVGSDGYTILVEDGKVLRGKLVQGAALVNLWLHRNPK